MKKPETTIYQNRTVNRWPPDSETTDHIACEEPLEIRVEGKSVAVTMRTPGDDLDLAAGFLFTEGVVDGPDDFQALSHVQLPSDPQQNTVDCVLAGGVEAHREAIEKATRELYATSSCGLCGKASIDKLLINVEPIIQRLALKPEVLLGLSATLREAQRGFGSTGGLHGAALFSPDGQLQLIREDIGRHNAVDKLIGARLRADQVPIDDSILLVSSRAGFEIVQKALSARISVVAAIGAPSTLAIDLAQDGGITLIGFLSGKRYNRYTH